jgi:DNA end-binding protein Ku
MVTRKASTRKALEEEKKEAKKRFYGMGTRPYWTGHIRISLVSFPVNVYSAVESSRKIAMHEIYRPTGERIHHQNVAGGEPVEREDIIKGYEFEKDSYVLIEPEEIDEIKVPSKETLDIAQFVDEDDINPIYFEKPYFVTPAGDIPDDAYIVIRDALRDTNKIGLGQISMAGREHICAIGPAGKGMFMQTLRYGEEIRNPEKYFSDISENIPSEEEIDMARELIKRKSAHFDPFKFHDHYKDALQELINAKIENRKPEYEEDIVAPKVVNLMDALKKSLAKNNDAAPVRKSNMR